MTESKMGRLVVAAAGLLAVMLPASCAAGDPTGLGSRASEVTATAGPSTASTGHAWRPTTDLAGGVRRDVDGGGPAARATEGEAGSTSRSMAVDPSAAGTEPGVSGWTPSPSRSMREGVDLPRCAELLGGWSIPSMGLGGWPDEPMRLEGRKAVEVLVEALLVDEEADPWSYWSTRDDVQARADARERKAAHLLSLVDEHGLYCGLVTADPERIARLRVPVPTLPPAGSVDEYTLWARNRCATAVGLLRDSIDAVRRVDDERASAGALAPGQEESWGAAFSGLLGVWYLGDEIENRHDVPPEAAQLRSLMVDVARELKRVTDSMGQGGFYGAADGGAVGIDASAAMVDALCRDADRAADKLRLEHVGR